jgi:hypothetical protein
MLRKEHRLRVFASGAPRKIFARRETTENCVTKSLIFCSFHQTLCYQIKDDEMGETCSWCWGEEKDVEGFGAES